MRITWSSFLVRRRQIPVFSSSSSSSSPSSTSRIWIWTGVNMMNSYALSPNVVHGCRPPPLLGDGCGGISRPAGTLRGLMWYKLRNKGRINPAPCRATLHVSPSIWPRREDARVESHASPAGTQPVKKHSRPR